MPNRNSSCRDHYRDSITEYPNECKDNHDGYNMGHPNQHHQPGESIVTFFVPFISWVDSFSFHLTEAEQIIIPRTLTSEVLAAIQSVRFIAQHIKDSDRDNEVSSLLHDSARAPRNMSIHAKTYDNFSVLMEP